MDLCSQFLSTLKRGRDSIRHETRIGHPLCLASDIVGHDNYRHPDMPEQLQTMVAGPIRRLPWRHKQPGTRGRL